MFFRDARHVYRAGRLDGLSWLEHGFGTRLAGAWANGAVASLRQVHSNRCLYAGGRTGCLGEGDALISDRPGQWLVIRTADCLPVLFADQRLKTVGAAHAGWRGTVGQIAARTVEALVSSFGSRPEDLVVVIGPGICAGCYSVGPEVTRQFRPWFPERSDLEQTARIDLAEANRRQLLAAGVPEGSIVTGAPCTACRPEEFFSHRRDPARAGRMVSAIGIRP